MFIGRKNELDSLEKAYETNKFELAIIYGRRRVGKTALIKKFINQRNGIFFVANQESKNDALKRMSQAVLEIFPAAKTYLTTFDSWDKILDYIQQNVGDAKFILTIDEYPYLASSDPSISSVIQNRIDHYLKNSKIKMILCGSSVSFMEKEVLGYDSPLYGRRTMQIKVKPLNYLESSQFFPDFTETDKLKAYGIVGGIPLYLELFSAFATIEEAIKELFLSPHGFLYEETMGLLRQELREPMLYNSILGAIADGSSKLNEIATKTGIVNAQCVKYLRTLENLHIISMELPIGNNAQKGHLYRLNDLMFRFWYRFIPENNSLIESGMADYIWDKKVKILLDQYMGYSFEIMAKELLAEKNRKLELPFVFETLGSWWGNNPITRQQEEIDLVAFSKDEILIGECKWRNENMGLSELETLKRRGSIISYNRKVYYIMFSKTGFTKELESLQKTDSSIILIGFNLEKD
jgi:AAA+ ATPase superfamily predicted ATPase